MVKEDFGVGVKAVGGGPITGRRDQTRCCGCFSEAGLDNEFGGRAGSVNGWKQMQVDQMVIKSGSEAKRATSGEASSIIGRCCIDGNSGKQSNGGNKLDTWFGFILQLAI
jgi:hypothetical protein